MARTKKEKAVETTEVISTPEMETAGVVTEVEKAEEAETMESVGVVEVEEELKEAFKEEYEEMEARFVEEGADQGEINKYRTIFNEEKRAQLEADEAKEDEKAEVEKEAAAKATNFDTGIASEVITDPIMGAQRTYKPQTGTNSYSNTTNSARGENGRCGVPVARNW